MYDVERVCVAFAGDELVAEGQLIEVARAVKAVADSGEVRTVLVFDATTSRPVELDLRGTTEDVVARLGGASSPSPTAEPRRRGRPKLGVVGKEVTLLPRHWEWLDAQPGGASVTLRKLVEAARRDTADAVSARQAQDAAYRFMQAMAGDQPGFEEAIRALYAGRGDDFALLVEAWPPDVAAHSRRLATRAFGD